MKYETKKAITQEELNSLFEEAKEEVKFILPYSRHILKNVKINNSKRAFATCEKKLPIGIYMISVSKYLLKCDKKFIKQALIHELIHTCEGCMNHGRNFIKYANSINRHLGYNISRTDSPPQEFVNQIKYKYKLTCSKCGKVIYMCRLSKNGIYCHTKDGGVFDIEKLY